MSINVLSTKEANSYNLYESPDCNLVNPISYFKEVRTALSTQLGSMRLFDKRYYETLTIKQRIDRSSQQKLLTKQMWEEEYKKIIDKPLPDSIIDLLQERKKKAQQKLLKRFTFESDMFMSIPIHAWNLFEMPYSKITAYHAPKELQGKKYPQLLHMHEENRDEFTIVGNTNMSQTELRLALEKRNRVLSNFIGDEEHWHCFFRTMDGIRGVEKPHVGQPHLHYISSAWGVKREEVISKLCSYRYYGLKEETINFDLTLSNLMTVQDYANRTYDVIIDSNKILKI